MLDNFIHLITQNKLQVHGIRVLQDGELKASHDFVPNIRYPIYSATKSFTSTAVGLAIQESELSLDDSVLKYLEEDLPDDVTSEIKDNLEKVTLKRLLTMSIAGYPFRQEGNDWLSFSLSVPLQNVEQKVFEYSNIPAYLTGVMVEKAVKQNLIDFLKPRLFDPLGIKDPEYTLCPKGHFYGASGMYLTVDELMKLGQLYYQMGYWNGKQILSSDWVDEATGKQIDTREGGYGYYFWRCQDNGYRISGKWGQHCFVFPDKKLLIAYLGNLQENADSKYVTQCMYETIWSRV